MPEKRLIPESAFFRLVNCVGPTSTFRHQEQSAGHGSVRHCPAMTTTKKASPVPLRFYLVSLSALCAVHGIFRFLVLCGETPRSLALILGIARPPAYTVGSLLAVDYNQCDCVPTHIYSILISTPVGV
jgi:hypothetical protein